MQFEVAPPLARGWTPCKVGLSRRGPRLPRSRGDGPCNYDIQPMVNMAPPLARGWTRHGTPWAVRARGSPARAGMDPLNGDAERRVRLPRSRGDGPFA